VILDQESRRELIWRQFPARDLRSTPGYVSLQDPGTPPLWWHQDSGGVGIPPSVAVSQPQAALLMALSDIDEFRSPTGPAGVPWQLLTQMPVLPEAHALALPK
jgi:hypothetical protein